MGFPGFRLDLAGTRGAPARHFMIHNAASLPHNLRQIKKLGADFQIRQTGRARIDLKTYLVAFHEKSDHAPLFGITRGVPYGQDAGSF